MSEKDFEFKSFLMGGFESCYALTTRERLDMLQATRHDEMCREDYRMLKERGIRTVRESLAWHQIDRGDGPYDFSRFEPMMMHGQEEQMQIIWSFNHFDFPPDVDLFSEEFITRFADYALEAVKVIRRYDTGNLFIIPINEISFLSLMCGETGHWWPFAENRGLEAKKQMIRATILAIQKIRNHDPDIFFIHGDPIMRRMAREDAHPDVRQYVEDFHEVVFQAWDIISGRLYPELGGSPDLIDMIGIHYYVYNQELVTFESPGRFRFEPLDFISEYRVEFHELVSEVYQRYRKPILISETGSFGSLREPWWNYMLEQVDKLRELDIPLTGICSYPIIDRPDWSDGHLTNSGFWDFENGDERCRRIPQENLLQLVKPFTR